MAISHSSNRITFPLSNSKLTVNIELCHYYYDGNMGMIYTITDQSNSSIWVKVFWNGSSNIDSGTDPTTYLFILGY